MTLRHVFAWFVVMVFATGLVQFIRLARWPFRLAFTLVCLLAIFTLPGCAALLIPFQPKDYQYNSNMAEGTWLVLDAVDTAQTMHIRASNPTCTYEADPIAAHLYGGREPTPSRVLATNLILAIAHTMVSSWLDDEVAKHDAADDGSVGPWFIGRLAWHTVSLVATGASVINNHNHGCAL